MKKHILYSLLFLGILAVLLLGLSWIFLPKDNTYAAGMEKLESYASGYLAEPENSLDLLALGDSMTSYALVPGELWQDYGICGYSLCGPNQAMTKALYYLNRFARHQQPKVVLLEAYELYQPITQQRVLEDLAASLVPIFKYHDNWKRPETLNPFCLPDHTVRNSFRGFYASFSQEPSQDNNDYMARDQEAEAVSPECMRYLRKIHNRCEEIGAKLILFSVPSRKSWDWGKHLGAQAAAEELGIPYLDLNLEKDMIDWAQDTTDGGIHLNYLGGTKVTAYLGNYLSNTKLLPDHRTDSAYSRWNEDAATLAQWVKTEVVTANGKTSP